MKNNISNKARKQLIGSAEMSTSNDPAVSSEMRRDGVLPMGKQSGWMRSPWRRHDVELWHSNHNLVRQEADKNCPFKLETVAWTSLHRAKVLYTITRLKLVWNGGWRTLRGRGMWSGLLLFFWLADTLLSEGFWYVQSRGGSSRRKSRSEDEARMLDSFVPLICVILFEWCRRRTEGGGERNGQRRRVIQWCFHKWFSSFESGVEVTFYIESFRVVGGDDEGRMRL